jgi:uncharacterized membrane-anchored protein
VCVVVLCLDSNVFVVLVVVLCAGLKSVFLTFNAKRYDIITRANEPIRLLCLVLPNVMSGGVFLIHSSVASASCLEGYA